MVTEMFNSESNGIRVRLNFEEGIDRENAWFYVDFSKVACVRRLRKKVCDRFELKREEINLYLDEYLLTPDETINVLQENDCVSVRLKTKEETTIEESTETKGNNQASAPYLTKRRRKDDDDDDDGVKHVDVMVDGLDAKKKKRIRNSLKGKQPEPQGNGGAYKGRHNKKPTRSFGKRLNGCSHSDGNNSKDTKMNKHIRFGEDDAQVVDENENDKSIMVDINQDNTGDGKKKQYDDLEPLQGPPRIGDTLAFKELVLSEAYTPEVSDFREGKVTAIKEDLITLFIKNRPTQPQRMNGKFELHWDEEMDIEPQTEFSHELTLPLTSLLHPKLMTLGEKFG